MYFKPTSIPRIVYQTWETKTFEPEFQRFLDEQKKINNNFQFVLCDASERLEFIKNNFSEEHVYTYNLLRPGAFKADFWRYCMLYIHGGFYMDIDMISKSNISSLLLDENVTFIAPIDLNLTISNHNVCNGFFGVTPKHPIMLECINRCIFNVKNQLINCITNLDVTGPGCLGQSVNRYMGRHEFESIIGMEGIHNDILLIKFSLNEVISDQNNEPLIINKHGSEELIKAYEKECKKIPNYISFVDFNHDVIYNYDRYTLDNNITSLKNYHNGEEAKFRLFKYCGVSDCIRRGFRWEEHQHWLADRFLNKDSIVIEAGSHIGTLTVKLSKCAGKVYAFEPIKQTLNVLKENIKINHCDNVEIINKGLSNEIGTTKVQWIHPNNPGGTGLHGSNVKKDFNDINEDIIVDLITIDSMNLDRLDYIKIDVEGYEHMVIEGAKETIRKFKPPMVIECFEEIGVNTGKIASNEYLNEKFKFLLDLGYTYEHQYFEDFLFLPSTN